MYFLVSYLESDKTVSKYLQHTHTHKAILPIRILLLDNLRGLLVSPTYLLGFTRFLTLTSRTH